MNTYTEHTNVLRVIVKSRMHYRNTRFECRILLKSYISSCFAIPIGHRFRFLYIERITIIRPCSKQLEYLK